MSVRTYKNLLAATDDELIAEHDHKAKHTEPGVNYYLNELSRRHTNRLTETMWQLSQSMEQATATIKRYTCLILLLTVVNIVFVGISTFPVAQSIISSLLK